MTYCTACGQPLPPSANFCPHCGAQVRGEASERAGDESTGPGAAPSRPGVTDSSPTLSFHGEGKFGADEAHLSAVDAAAVSALPAGSALLLEPRGPEAGARYLLDAPTVTAGRHPTSDIFLDDVTVSRRHAVFRREAGEWSVSDARSLNGTYVNGRRVERAVVRAGDKIQIGRFALTFFPASAGAGPGPES